MTELYTHDEMTCVMSHIEKSFGSVTNILHEIVSPDIHVDICVIPPHDESAYYTLVTMGMGAHRMNVPDKLKEKLLERAELVIALPKDWDIQSKDRQWYWPILLLKDLARLPGQMDTWLGWGHAVDDPEPYADNVPFSSAILIGAQAGDEDASICKLPDGDEVNFYQVIPLYREESAFHTEKGADALLEHLRAVSWVVDPTRPNVLNEEEVPNELLDDAEWHLESVRDKELPVDEINAFNHMAIFLRWCIEHHLMGETFTRDYPEALTNPKDLRGFIRDRLDGKLLRSMLNNEGYDFARYYYGDNDQPPYYPCDVDDHAYRLFGPSVISAMNSKTRPISSSPLMSTTTKKWPRSSRLDGMLGRTSRKMPSTGMALPPWPRLLRSIWVVQPNTFRPCPMTIHCELRSRMRLDMDSETALFPS